MHSTEQQREKYRNHAQVWELLPWYINGTLPDEEKQSISRHVAVCLLCSKELRLQAALRDSVRSHELDELMMVASFDRLSAKLRAEEEDLRPPFQDDHVRPVLSAGKVYGAVKCWLQRQFGSAWLLPALSALAVVVILPGVAQLLLGNHTFTTLSDGATTAAVTADFRLIFAAGVPETDREAILDHAGLSIVAGPDERGLYFVNAPEDIAAAALDATLEQLRSDEKIMFAEPATRAVPDSQLPGER